MVIKKTSKTKKNEPKLLTLLADSSKQTNRIYSNFVAVNHSLLDISLRFCDAPPLFEDIQAGIKNNKLNVPVVAEIAISPNIVPSLIVALQLQYDKFIQNQSANSKKEKEEQESESKNK